MRYIILVLTFSLVACGQSESQVAQSESKGVATEDFIVPATPDELDTSKFEQTKEKAMHGDYQAQRNLAYGYSSWPYPGQDKNPISACAWRMAILKSGSERVDSTDVSNQKVDCESLDASSLEAAEAQALGLMSKIVNN